MKKIIRYVLYFVVLLAVGIGILLTYIKTALPDVGAAAELKIDYTPERIKRGEYLANTVTVCIDCHSTRDFTKFSGPPMVGTFGKGGDIFDQAVGMPGVFYAKNITSEGIARYTDGELFRVITTGVTKEGRPMFPLMPYLYYGGMDPEDIYSIIAYVRSLPPIVNAVPESVSDFPMNVIIHTLPQKANPQKRPDKSDVFAYGSYLTNASGCVECHTQVDKGQIIKEVSFGGGREFTLLDGSVVRSANISPDPKTGIGSWTEDLFLARFKVYADSLYENPTVAAGEFNTIMPWLMYGQMEREDLAAIFTYLKSVKPVENVVVKFTPTAK